VTTRSGLRTLVRLELNDSGGTALWSDGLINEWLAEAIRDFSRKLPKAATETIVAVADQADYTLAARCLRVARVEHPEGFFRIPDPLSAGDYMDPWQWSTGTPRAVAEQLSYEVWGEYGALTLTLRPAPTAASESIVVREWQLYAEPSADGDTLATPTIDDHLLLLYVCGRALRWIGLDEAKRQRFERQRGANPVALERDYFGEYNRQIGERAKCAAPRRLVVRR
jgi:hypothetical protein